jgi:hypothetical protein
MDEIVHLRIKKQYAAALIEDLIQAQALEPIADFDIQVPEWQKEAVRQTLLHVQQHPEQLQSWDLIKEKYQRP